MSGELHKANHTIATAFPDQVQYAMLQEEDDNVPKAFTPVEGAAAELPVPDQGQEAIAVRSCDAGNASKAAGRHEVSCQVAQVADDTTAHMSRNYLA
jgi:hypothetical protein